MSLGRIGLNAEGVVAVLQQPEHYKNRPVYVADYAVSTNELIAIAEKVSPSADRPWKVIDIPDVPAIGRQMWAEDTKAGSTDRLHSEAWMGQAGSRVYLQ